MSKPARQPAIEQKQHSSRRALFIFGVQFALLLVLALALRLLAWRWHELYELGGDEREYFNQALTLLRDHTYIELNLMRPPLYTGFLALCMALFDSLVQRLRLVQAIIGALTLVPLYLGVRRLFGSRVAWLAALLAALNYTLAAHAAELLTETLFVFGLALLFWLLLCSAPGWRPSAAADRLGPRELRSRAWPFCAGLVLGALTLLRSVALPLLPLGALWLLLRMEDDGRRALGEAPLRRRWSLSRRAWPAAMAFVLASVLVIAPWTLRNYSRYGALIIVDTTGAENLWLDNNPAGSTAADPLGREAAKRQLYALGDDRAARQRLASANGLAAILGHPAWFVQKAWGEAKEFFALEYFDDLRARRAIWVPPLEVWLRVLLGDGMWLLLVLAGTAGLWLAGDEERLRLSDSQSNIQSHSLPTPISQVRWLYVPWALYTVFTALLFHVELRYRLPLYPVLLPYAAWALSRVGRLREWQAYAGGWRTWAAALSCLALMAIVLLHQPYAADAWMLARKHVQLWQAERALAQGDGMTAALAAHAALELDPDSALARVALARAALAQEDRPGALAALDRAVAALRAQPYAHLLRGALLRAQGDTAGAQPELAYERSSLEDLQSWAWDAFGPLGAPPTALDLGAGSDLGYMRGFWLAEPGPFRWSKDAAQVQLSAPERADMRLELQLSSGRPAAAPAPRVTITAGGARIAQFEPMQGWHSYSFAIPAALIPDTRRLVLSISSDTFRPRDFDRASPDDRTLGVMLRAIKLVAP